MADTKMQPLLIEKTENVRQYYKSGLLGEGIIGLNDVFMGNGIQENAFTLDESDDPDYPDLLYLEAYAYSMNRRKFATILIAGGVPIWIDKITKESFVIESKTPTGIGYIARLKDLITTLKEPTIQAITPDHFVMKPMIRRYRDEDTGTLVTKYFAALVTDNDTEMVMEGVTIKQFDQPTPNANYPSHFMIADGYPVIDNNVIVQTPVGTEMAFATADLLKQDLLKDTPSTEIDPQEFEKFPIETVALLVYPSGTTRVVKKGSYVVEVNDYVVQPTA